MTEFSEIKGYLIDSHNQLMQSVSEYLPNLVGAIILLLLGLMLASLVRWLILRLGAGIDRVIQAAGAGSFHLRMKWPVAAILGWIVYWLIILLFVRAALTSLKLPSLVEMLGRLFNYLPNIIIGALLIVGGVLIGNAVRDKITDSSGVTGLRRADQLGSFVRLSIIIVAVILGLSQIGLDVSLAEYLLIILVAALAGAIALAFGLGAGSTVSNIISARYVRRNYRVGQRIRIEDLEGKILELVPTGVFLETKAGRTFIPAKLFADQASVLLDHETSDDH